MRREATVLVLLLVGLTAGLIFSGAFDAPGPGASAVERTGPRASAAAASSMAATEKESADLADLRVFAGKLERLFQTVAGEVSPAVVLIESEQTVRIRVPASPFRSPFDDFFEDFFGERPMPRVPERQREFKRRGLGSGCILDEDGNILTNNHVVANADELTVKLADGRSFEAEVAGTDPKTDLAVIRIVGKAEDLPTVKLGDSDTVNVGQWAIAVGNPFGLRHSVSAGIISATGRSIGVAEYESLIQTDAAINRGNSGGPLVNLECEVIGINTAIVGRANLGIGFAIPINMARDILEDLIEGREIVRGYLGVYPKDLTPEMAEAFGYEGTDGALVDEVLKDSPADEAGLKAGDIIVEFDGRPVRNSAELRRRVAGTEPGSRASVKFWRDGEMKTVTVEAGDLAAAEETTHDWLGLHVQTLTPEMARNMGKPDLEGVLVADVDENSPAAEHFTPGDVILSVNRTKVRSASEYARLMAAARKEGGVLLRVLDAETGRARFLFVRNGRNR
jgi:serine protease Do